MNPFQIVGGILILLCALVIIVCVMMMEGKGGGMNALAGSNESSYLGKNRNRSAQATLSRVSKYAGIGFVVLTLALYVMSALMKG